MKQADILIYSPKTTNRLQYIMELYFDIILNVSYKICNDVEEFNAYEGVKFNYSKQAFDNECFIASDNFLFIKDIGSIEIKYVQYQNMKCLFPTTNTTSLLPFDPFAAAFYLISRYEEYLPYLKDEHGRFPASESVAYRLTFLEKPVINIWAQELKKILSKKYPQIRFPKQRFQYKPTIDIDIAYLYKNKGFYRTFGAIIKDIIHLKYKLLKKRINILINKAKDPYDIYDFIFEIHQNNDLASQYFFLIGDLAKHDRNIHFKNKKFRNLIRRIDEYASIGIHPSYQSHFVSAFLTKEKIRLEKIIDKKITQSRYHFLKMEFPKSYQNLINNRIIEECSMGYASKPGFRAGICTPFYFFDLENDIKTNLKVFPFTVMDVTLKNYAKLSPEEAIDKIKSLIDEIKAVNGTFISLWHNESLSEVEDWKNWRKVYTEMIKYAVEV